MVIGRHQNLPGHIPSAALRFVTGGQAAEQAYQDQFDREEDRHSHKGKQRIPAHIVAVFKLLVDRQPSEENRRERHAQIPTIKDMDRFGRERPPTLKSKNILVIVRTR
jgi:hypothetical protein